MPYKDPERRKQHHRDYMRQRFQEDAGFRAAHIKRVRGTSKVYAEKAAEMTAAFRSNGCLLCPERDRCCLTAHHVDPGQKSFDLGNARNGRYTPRQVEDELKKCVCLCMNCHAKVHAGVRHLPQNAT